MNGEEMTSLEEKAENGEEAIFAKYGIRPLSIPKTQRRKVTKESIAFCCSKSSLDERDINQCTQCVI